MIQLQILNYILQNKDISFITGNGLTVDFFSDYKNEFNFIVNHYNTYGVVPDQLTFLNYFPDFDIITVQESRKYLLDALYSDARGREVVNIFNRIRSLITSGKNDEAFDLLKSASANTSDIRRFESIDIFKDLSRYDDYIAKGNDQSKYFVPTGFNELDDIIGGWDRREELATIVARTGVGKTWTLLKTAIAGYEAGLTVGIFSGEMSANTVGYRLDTLISHISNGALIHGNQTVKDEYAHYMHELSNRTGKGKIKILTPDMIATTAGVSALRAFIESDKLDMLCIDQHSLLEDDRKARNPVERAANISKDLKNLQVQKRIPIIAVSQQNRTQMENGTVDSMQIAASDRIGQDSSTIIFIVKKDDVVELNLVKSRNSVSGKKISYAVDINRGVFKYIPEDGNAVDGEGAEALKQEFEYADSVTEADVF